MKSDDESIFHLFFNSIFQPAKQALVVCSKTSRVKFRYNQYEGNVSPKYFCKESKFSSKMEILEKNQKFCPYGEICVKKLET